MAEALKLEIITPKEIILETETEWVTVPGSEGELGILPDHVPLMTTLDTGILQFAGEGEVKKVAIHYGYTQVQGNVVTVLSEMAEHSQDIDLQRAQDAEQRARITLQELRESQEQEAQRMAKYEAKLKRAMVRQILGNG